LTFEILILGTSAAIQANGRHQSAQVLKLDKQYFLIDCGEGTQEQLVRRRINTNKISKIFISHLHGDHFLGLFGLLCTMSLLGRVKALEIYGPKGLREIISTQLKYSQSYFNYPVEFIETTPFEKNELCSNSQIEVYSFPLEHGIECTGFLFNEKPKSRRIDHTKLPAQIQVHQLKQLKQGLDIELETGEKYSNESLTFQAKKSRSYAYCSDTRYSTQTSKYIQNVDILYHESTFIAQHEDKALATYHSLKLRQNYCYLVILAQGIQTKKNLKTKLEQFSLIQMRQLKEKFTLVLK
jgi:ribonuclease Z